MPGLIDLKGRRYGKLVVELLFGKDDYSRAIWWCRCDCGRLEFKSAQNLVAGRTKSCGSCEPNVLTHPREMGRKGGESSGTWRSGKEAEVA